jgi:uncharacterized protein YggE
MKTAILLAALITPMTTFGFGSQPQHVPPTPPDLAGAQTATHAVAPVITVSGSGLVERKPDYAVVHVGVYARSKSASEAAANAGNLMKKVADAVRGLNLDAMQLQTSEVSLNPAYIWRQDNAEQRQELVGYDASSTLRVRVSDPATIGKVLDAAIEAGANRIHGVSFELKDALNARQEALGLAARSARDKAEVLAEALGLRITGVVSVNAGADPAPWQPMANRMEMAAAAPGGLGESIEPGTVSVRADATVTFSASPVR